MKVISLENSALLALVDDSDYEQLAQRKWYFLHDYAISDSVLMHRLIARPCQTQIIDHIDGNTLNNQRSNLRICSVAENLWNRRATWSASGFKGVSRRNRDRSPWRASITKNGRAVHLGSFADPVDAAKAYDAAAKKLFGEFACTNADLGLL